MLRIQRRQSARSTDPRATPEIAVRRRAAPTTFFHLILALLAAMAVAGCATPQAPPPRPDALLRDDLFGPSSVVVDANEIFALSDAMKRYLRTDVFTRTKAYGIQGGLFEALYNRAMLKLDYDSSVTRTAAEAFDARSGNCLSLVLMTAAFAKEMGLQVRYQSAYLEETWSRSGNTLLRAGHVNVTLGPPMQDRANALSRSLTIDFLPSDQLRGLRTREVTEQTIVAMFMNNRGVEAMLRGQMDDAYAWTRASLQSDPSFMSAYNTLGIIYARRDNLDLAEAAFRSVVEREPEHTRAMANLAEVYTRQGRVAEATALRLKLAQLEPEPPYYFFNQGMEAMRRNDFSSARDLFAREAARIGYSTEVTYWLGVAHYRLGDTEKATRYLNQALEGSASRSDRELLSTKLSRLKSRRE
jgi:Flp pilus assembly protein TadD